jgi:predicted aspartyl protease
MAKSSILLVVPVLAMLASCVAPTQSAKSGSTSPELTVDQQDAEIAKTISARVQSIGHDCEIIIANESSLDPIRRKIELTRDLFDNETPAPLSILTDDSMPTQQERNAIERWSIIHAECAHREYMYLESLPEARVSALGDVIYISHQEDQRHSDLVAALYRGQITYSVFARKRIEIANQYVTAMELLDKEPLTGQQALRKATQSAPVTPLPEVIPDTQPVITNPEFARDTEEVKLQKQGNIYVVAVRLNGAVTLGFVVDSGAADVLIPNDVLLTLVRTGTVTEADFIGEQTYSLADGSKLTSTRFNIRELQVGNHLVKNVIASVGPVASDPLLGQSFLSKVKAWALDNTRHVLVLSEKSQVQQ